MPKPIIGIGTIVYYSGHEFRLTAFQSRKTAQGPVYTAIMGNHQRMLEVPLQTLEMALRIAETGKW